MRSLLVFAVALAAVPVLAGDPGGPVPAWAYVEVDDARGKWGDTDEPDWLRYFGIDAADMDADGDLDIVSGRYVYRNPGGDMDAWERVDLGTNADGMVAVDIDGDAHPDVVAQALPEVVWLEAEGPDLREWRRTVIGTLPKTGHTNGQGYGKGDLDGDGRPEVLLTAADGIYAAVIPKDPEGPWPWVRVVERGTDEGFAVVDVDGDGDADIVGGDGPPGDEDPTVVAWWANPGSLGGVWERHVVGETAHAVDRVVARDLNGDGRVDVAVSEERYPGKEPDAHLWWFEATAAGPDAPFTRHELIEQYSMNNLDAGDIDGDGDVDLVTGEHKGPDLRLQVFENDGQGAFTLREIDRGKECHLGTRLYDLDGDGDLDIVGPAWDEWRFLHLWRNEGS